MRLRGIRSSRNVEDRCRSGARGDFAVAYVIAHEVAHHHQNELDILGPVNERRQTVGPTQANALTVRLELKADCLLGVWARFFDALLEPGDLEEALNAARMIGDDYHQACAGCVPKPHSFTHGTPEQCARWFATAYQIRDIHSGDTFGAQRL
jgi:predicted metalloprotease